MKAKFLNQLPELKMTAYWAGVLLHSAATTFIDEDYINLARIVFALVIPILLVSTKAFAAEMHTFLQAATKVASTCGLCQEKECLQ